MITTHPAHEELQELAKKEGKPIHAILAERLEALKREAGLDSLTRLTKDVHFYPDLHGNVRPMHPAHSP
jgi:ribulose kinase